MANNTIHQVSSSAETVNLASKSGVSEIFLLALDIETSGHEMKILLGAITDKMFYLLDDLGGDGPVSNETMTTVNAIHCFISCAMRTMTSIHDQSVEVMRAAKVSA